MDLFHKDKLQMNIITLMPHDICRKMLGKIFLKSGMLGTGFLTMRMWLPILLSLFGNLQLKTIVIPHLPYSPCDFINPKSQVALKGMRFVDLTMFKQNYRIRLPSFIQMNVTKIALNCVTITGLGVWSPKETTLKGQYWLEGKCCYGEINLVQKVYDHITYYVVSPTCGLCTCALSQHHSVFLTPCIHEYVC